MCRVPIIEPVPDSTKLRVSDGGLQLLRSMTGRLAPVVVIGPYRSGKSFLINQMLDIPCGARPRSSVKTMLGTAMSCERWLSGRRSALVLQHGSTAALMLATDSADSTWSRGTMCRQRHGGRPSAHHADAGRVAVEQAGASAVQRH